MTQYPAWIDGKYGSYGVSFPDLPGIVAMGTTVYEAMMHAEEALRDYALEAECTGDAITPLSTIERGATPAGHTPVFISIDFLSPTVNRATTSREPLPPEAH